jgi:hypothetical protein
MGRGWRKLTEKRCPLALSEWQPRNAAEPDDRWKVWLRMRPLEERKAEIARDLGYRDGGSVLQIIKRLEISAQTDPAHQRKKLAYEALLSSVESCPLSYSLNSASLSTSILT